MRGRRGRRAAAATVLALAAGPLAACSDDGPELPLGTPFAAGSVFSDRVVTRDTSSDHMAWIPGGQVRVTLDVGSRTTWRGRQVSAPSGKRLVNVSWVPDTGPEGAPPWPGGPSGGLPGTRIVLEVDGKRFPVAEAVRSYDASGEVVMVLPGRETDAPPKVVLEAGGCRTVVAPGTELPTGARFVTTSRPLGGVEMGLHLPLDVQRSPYVAGLGWAPRGQVWVVVPAAQIGWDGTGKRSDDDAVWLIPRRVSAGAVAADGAAPARVLGPDVAGTDSATTASRAWLVPAGSTARLTLRVRGDGVPEEGGRAVRRVGTDVAVVVKPAPGG